MSLITTKQVCTIIDQAPEDLRSFAQREQQEHLDLTKGAGWGYGSAKSCALYLDDSLRHEDTSDVDWAEVAEHLDNTLTVEAR